MAREKELYEEDDWIMVTDPVNKYFLKTGRIKSLDILQGRYWVTLDVTKTMYAFYPTQMMRYVADEDLDALIDLCLKLGKPAKKMFRAWVNQLKAQSRTKKRE